MFGAKGKLYNLDTAVQRLQRLLLNLDKNCKLWNACRGSLHKTFFGPTSVAAFLSMKSKFA